MRMSKFKRFIGLVLVMASLFGSLGAMFVEPFDFEAETDEMIGSEIISDEMADDTEATQDAETEETTDTEVAGSTEPQGITTLEYYGDTYSVTASYGPETGIPSGCTLVVSEIPGGDVYDEYCGLASEALDKTEINSIRVFDICIMKDGVEVEPVQGTSVSVKITLAESLNDDVSVVHINDDSEAKVISNPLVSGASEGEGTEVSFYAEGFSAYAIVEGPSSTTITSNWKRIESLEELAAHSSEVYIGNPNSNYYMNGNQITISGSRTGIQKTNSQALAVPYVFESTGTDDQYRIYTVVDGVTKYIKQSGNSLALVTDSSQATVFTLSDFPNKENEFRAEGTGGYYINQQGGAGGKGFAAYNNATDPNAELAFWYDESSTQIVDPYHLDGVTKGLIYYNSGVVGRGLMGYTANVGTLAELDLPVLTQESNHQQKIFVPNNTDLTMWTFNWVRKDKYTLSAQIGGTTKYLNINSTGVSMSDTPQEITVVPGTGTNEGKISLTTGNVAIEYSGVPEVGFDKVSSSTSSSYKWLNLVDLSELTSDYILPYSAKKISVSDESLTDGSKVIIYTRVWDNDQKKYRFFAVNHLGELQECYEEGDEIKWIGDRINTLLWDLTVYYYEGQEHTIENENHYYELYNEYSEKYIRPDAGSTTALGNSITGINLNGRREGDYYTTIVAWDDKNYAYAGIKTDMSDPDHPKIVSYPYVDGVSAAESVDFYFAIIDEPTYDGALHEVETVDNNLYGINMKIIDFNTQKLNWMNSEQSVFLGSTAGGLGANPTQGLLSTELVDGYPYVTQGTYAGTPLSVLYDPARLRTVNHLFIESTYNTSGYFVYDSTQNFASLKDDNNFVVYQELATIEDTTRPSLQHGQFMPFNDIDPTKLSSTSPYNMYSALQEELADENPRKYEQLYSIPKNSANYQFGVELETQFVQTPSGLDDWGHDIIYEFTGDDDFWLYVDNELVIDLGGTHSALYGSINYSTGEVKIQERGRAGAPQPGDIVTYNLRDIFYNNYIGRGHTAEEAQAYVDDIFEPNEAGQYVFKDYTAHKMKIFFMERGGGASNLQMRFNQSSVKPGSVILSKELTGVDNIEKFNAEFPYQIWYEKEGENSFSRLTNHDQFINVVYRGTNKEVKYAHEYYIDGILYEDVYFLEPGESAEIKLPDETILYYVVECGVDPNVYLNVKCNGDTLTGAQPENADPSYDGRLDYAVPALSAKDRTSVKYVNEVDESALRTLTFKKVLYDNTLENELRDDDTKFNFRLYLATEHETAGELKLANMYTYHVKDPDGVYCKWDAENQSFVPVRANVTDFSALTDSEKRAASFTTSMNGSISKIPAFYTVEIRELLAGTQYEIEERYNEIPDGYSRHQYVVYDDSSDPSTRHTPSHEESVNTILTDKDPYVEVQNLKGFGIRIYKEWSDEKFVSERDNAYFAIYKDGANGEELVDDTIYMLAFRKDTLYWYFERLEQGETLQNYHVREVILTNPVVDGNGKVTSYGSITPVADGDPITLNGKLKGDSASTQFTYNVNYDPNPAFISNNMRVETIRNVRDGITIYKVDNNNDPIAGAVFTLVDEENQTMIGTFESDSDGFVTIAYLRKGVDYTLNEIKSPAGHAGLKNPLTINMANDGTITVTADPSTATIDETRFTYEAGPTDPSITIKNICYDFIVSKRDKVTHQPVEGVVFELHKQKTVGGVTVVDFQAMPGYEHLTTGADGTVPGIDSTLAPGTYELREVSAPGTHQQLNYYILFTVTQTGDIRLNGTHPDVEIDEDIQADKVVYTLFIYNDPVEGDLMLTKEVRGNLGNKTEEFQMTITLTTDTDQPYIGTFYTKKNNEAPVEHVLSAADMGVITLGLAHGDTIVFTGLDDGTKYTITEDAHGYQSKGYLDGVLVSENGTVSGNTADNNRVLFVNTRDGLIPTGLETNFSISLSILVVMAAGLVFTLTISRKRRYEEDR